MRRRALVLSVALAVLAAGCGLDDIGGEGTASTTTLGPAPPDTTAPLELAAGQVAHDIGTTFQYGAFLITIGTVVYDETVGTLHVAARYRNISEGTASPETGGALVLPDGTEFPLFGVVFDVPPGMSGDATTTVESLAEDPVPDAAIAWGRPDRDRPIISLAGDGAGENIFRPTPLAVDGWASIGKYSVHVTGAELLAGPLYMNIQSDPGERVLRFTFDQFTATKDPVNGFYPSEHLTLVRPDGELVEGIESSTGFAPMSWTATGGNWIEFPVSAEYEGAYELRLTSLSPKGFSTLHPELVEYVTIPFKLAAVEVAAPPEGEGLPRPLLTPIFEAVPGAEGFDVDLDAGAMNLSGFMFEPTNLTWDPATVAATVTGTASYIQAEDDEQGGLLDIDPEFSFTPLLASGGQLFGCLLDAPVTVTAGAPAELTYECPNVPFLDPDSAGLLMGPRSSQSSSMPLGPDSPIPTYPPPPVEATIEAPEATAGDWTIQLESYRLGLLQSAVTAPPGRRQLEVRMSVTASASTVVPALGLVFTPSVQVFLAGADGYLAQPVADSGTVAFEPGETHQQSVTFSVPDSFTGGDLTFALRSKHEVRDITIERFVETRFVAKLEKLDGARTDGGL